MLTAWSKNGWRPWHLGAAGVMALAAILTHYTAWADIAGIAYNDEEDSHIFLVPVVVAALIWVRARRFRNCRPGGGVVGLAILLAGVVISAVGYHRNVQSMWHGGALLALIGAVVTVLGKDILLAFLPAFVVLLFLIPVPGRLRFQIANPLQSYTAQIMTEIFQLLGFNVVQSGNSVHINGQDVLIAEACNGMRGVFGLFLISYAFAFFVPLRGYVRFFILLASPLSALLWNVIRLIPTIYLYGYATKRTADDFHEFLGWVMLPAAFLLLMAVIAVLKWALLPVAPYTLAYD